MYGSRFLKGKSVLTAIFVCSVLYFVTSIYKQVCSDVRFQYQVMTNFHTVSSQFYLGLRVIKRFRVNSTHGHLDTCVELTEVKLTRVELTRVSS